MNSVNQIICLMGPTASGKTSLASTLASEFPVDVISVDSALVYRSMDIGTAKPTQLELTRTPHHIIDLLDPSDTFSAGEFCQLAMEHIRNILGRGRIPLLVGGTMLYFKRLLYGFGDLPTADEDTRRQIEEEARQQGWGQLHSSLKSFDIESYHRIHPNDSQRIQRAIEVYRLTGRTMSELRNKQAVEFPYQSVNVILEPRNRQFLHARIEQRLNDMFNHQFVDEVKRLYERGDLSANLPSIRSVGYRQVWAYLNGEYDEATMRQKALVATRQLAKRQLTWLRRWPDAKRFTLEDVCRDDSAVVEYIKRSVGA